MICETPSTNSATKGTGKIRQVSGRRNRDAIRRNS
jgi:hypothetical protein